LGQAHDAVSDELKRLDEATDACLTQVTQTFKEIASLAEKRSMALSNAVKEARDKKKQVLEEQLKLIASEKAKVGIETLTLPCSSSSTKNPRCKLSLGVLCSSGGRRMRWFAVPGGSQKHNTEDLQSD